MEAIRFLTADWVSTVDHIMLISNFQNTSHGPRIDKDGDGESGGSSVGRVHD